MSKRLAGPLPDRPPDRLAGFLALTALPVTLVALAGSLAGCGEPSAAERPAHPRGLVILGVDGMDPQLLDQYMREGRMPVLAGLAERGSYQRLGTTFPPQSPVAWSTFLTGLDHDGHGIFDFVHRDPAKLSPYLSTSMTEGPGRVLRLGSLALPLSSPAIKLLREGPAFWQILEDAGVPATIVKIPANFPPAPSEANESMSGMGTPDLLGTYGTFQYYTDDPERAARSMAGGIVHQLDFGTGQRAATWLDGPPDPLSTSAEVLRLPVTVIRDRDHPVALVRLGDSEVVLQPREWSDWVPVAFDPGALSGEVAGMVRLYLGELRPHLELYVSPINIDPTDPVMPVSAPASYADRLAAEIGRFYTQGMPEDTKALAAGALDDDEFLAQAELVIEERLRLLDRELDRYTGGALFFYFSSIDQLSHVFFRSLEPDASPEDARYAHVIPDLYQRIDGVIGQVLERVGPDVDVIVMSDHGFSPYRYKVNLNTWLAQQGYLSLLGPDQVGEGPLGHIDWEKTQAYALGLNQLFINLRGREARGVVPREEYDVLLRRLVQALESLRDPNTGARIITEAVRPQPGQFADRAPDLLIGYNRTYRSSDEAALGMVTGAVVERNRDKWSGDHCMHPAHVPGVVFTTWRPGDAVSDPTLADMAPTILSYFGVDVPAELTGRSLWSAGQDGEKP